MSFPSLASPFKMPLPHPAFFQSHVSVLLWGWLGLPNRLFTHFLIAGSLSLIERRSHKGLAHLCHIPCDLFMSWSATHSRCSENVCVVTLIAVEHGSLSKSYHIHQSAHACA